MLRTSPDNTGKFFHVTLVTPDPAVERTLAPEFKKELRLGLRCLHGPLRDHVQSIVSDQDAAAIIVEIDPASSDDLAALQQVREASGGRLPVLVATERLYHSPQRQLLHLQVSDWIAYPLNTQGGGQACKRAIHAGRSASLSQGGSCYAFIGAAGGVGTTVLAVETAFLLARRSKQPERTCLIDLDFQSGTVAQYLN